MARSTQISINVYIVSKKGSVKPLTVPTHFIKLISFLDMLFLFNKLHFSILHNLVIHIC